MVCTDHSASINLFIVTPILSLITRQFFSFPGMKINKLLLPFFMGVVMKIASIVPVILSIMGAMALNALMAGKGALMIAGIMGKAD
jgi:hypothetical protein